MDIGNTTTYITYDNGFLRFVLPLVVMQTHLHIALTGRTQVI